MAKTARDVERLLGENEISNGNRSLQAMKISDCGF